MARTTVKVFPEREPPHARMCVVGLARSWFSSACLAVSLKAGAEAGAAVASGVICGVLSPTFVALRRQHPDAGGRRKRVLRLTVSSAGSNIRPKYSAV